MVIYEFSSGDGRVGRISSGFRDEPVRVKQGKKNEPGRVLFKGGGGSSKNKKKQAVKKEAPQEYTVKSSTGEEVQVKVEPKSSYPGVRVAQSFGRSGNLTTEQANRIAQQNPELAGNPNRRYIAVSSEDIQRTNEELRSAGYPSAKELVNAINRGEVTVNPDKTLTITRPSTTETITETTTTPGTVPPPKEAVEYLNRRNFGVADYFERLTASGIKNQASSIYNVYQNKRASQSDVINYLQGKIQLGLGFPLAVASNVFEPMVYGVSQKRRYDEGIPEAEFQSGIYEPIIEKENEQTILGILQLSALTQGVQVRPSEAVPVKTFTPLETEPYIFIKPYEEPFRLPTITRNAQGELIIEPTTTIKGGLGMETNEPLPITKIDFKSLGATGKKTITFVEPPTPKGTQSQIYPKEIPIEPYRIPSDLPTPKELKTVYERQFNGKLTISRAEMEEPEFIPQYKKDLYKYVEETSGKTSSLTASDVFATVRETGQLPPTTKQTLLQEFKPIKVTSSKQEVPILSEDVIVFETPKGKFSLLGGKKGQASLISPGGELDVETGGKVYEIYGGNEFEKFFREADILTHNELAGTRKAIITPLVLRRQYAFKTDAKSIVQSISSVKFKVDYKTLSAVDISSQSDVQSKTRSKTRSKSISDVRSDVISDLRSETIQETIQEQETRPIIYPSLRLNPYKPREEPPREEPPGKPDVFKKIKLDNQQKASVLSGYNVFVKSKGTFNKVNMKPLGLKSAFGLGANIVEKSSSASFKILPLGVGKSSPGIISGLTNKNFYSSKGGLFVEKPSKRINTPGELQGITWRGIRSKKLKKIFG